MLTDPFFGGFDIDLIITLARDFGEIGKVSSPLPTSSLLFEPSGSPAPRVNYTSNIRPNYAECNHLVNT